MNDRHIIDDPERASEYVLGRLSPAERERIDAHVGACPECRALLERELRVAAAARRLGRDGMKARLRSGVTRSHRAARILAVAATIASLIGIGVVTRHVLVEQEIRQETPSMTDRVAPPQEQQALRTTPPAAGGAADRGTVDKLRERSREDTREIPRDRDETVASNVAAPAPSVQEHARKAEAAPIQDLEVAGKVATGDSYWTDGIVSPPPEREERMMNAVAKEKKDVAGKGTGNAAEAPQFVLTQRRAADLPLIATEPPGPPELGPDAFRAAGVADADDAVPRLPGGSERAVPRPGRTAGGRLSGHPHAEPEHSIPASGQPVAPASALNLTSSAGASSGRPPLSSSPARAGRSVPSSSTQGSPASRSPVPVRPQAGAPPPRSCPR